MGYHESERDAGRGVSWSKAFWWALVVLGGVGAWTGLFYLAVFVLPTPPPWLVVSSLVALGLVTVFVKNQ